MCWRLTSVSQLWRAQERGWGGGDGGAIITQPHWILLHSSALTVSVIVDGLLLKAACSQFSLKINQNALQLL